MGWLMQRRIGERDRWIKTFGGSAGTLRTKIPIANAALKYLGMSLDVKFELKKLIR